jgi:hypothetical protein
MDDGNTIGEKSMILWQLNVPQTNAEGTGARNPQAVRLGY